MSDRLPLKALVLAAGLGSRLRPITNHTPKPLLPFFDEPLLSWAISSVKNAGISSVAVNSHHLSSHIQQYLELHHRDVYLSYERTELLGTGGAISKMRPWIGQNHLLIYNADIISDIDLRKLIDTHFSGKALATMCLLNYCPEGKNPVFYSNGQVCGIGAGMHSPHASKHTLACAHIISPDFMEFLPKKATFFNIIDAYLAALAKHEIIHATIHDGLWYDLGTPRDLWQAYSHILKHHEPISYLSQLKRFCGLSDGRQLVCQQTKLGVNITWADACKLPESCFNVIHLSEGKLGSDCHWHDVLTLPESQLPITRELSNAIVFRDKVISTL